MHAHRHSQAHTHAHTHTHTYLHFTHLLMFTHVYTFGHTHTHTHTHTQHTQNTHTHTHAVRTLSVWCAPVWWNTAESTGTALLQDEADGGWLWRSWQNQSTPSPEEESASDRWPSCHSGCHCGWMEVCPFLSLSRVCVFCMPVCVGGCFVCLCVCVCVCVCVRMFYITDHEGKVAWPCFRIERSKSVTYTLSTWDFAGQEDFYSTHQCFLSNRTLYLVSIITDHFYTVLFSALKQTHCALVACS